MIGFYLMSTKTWLMVKMTIYGLRGTTSSVIQKFVPLRRIARNSISSTRRYQLNQAADNKIQWISPRGVKQTSECRLSAETFLKICKASGLVRKRRSEINGILSHIQAARPAFDDSKKSVLRGWGKPREVLRAREMKDFSLHNRRQLSKRQRGNRTDEKTKISIYKWEIKLRDTQKIS